jgi:tyrosyl-tRNA synthetase
MTQPSPETPRSTAAPAAPAVGQIDPFLAELSWRGLIKQVSHPLEELTVAMTPSAEKGFARAAGYLGIDPTADSLHVGHFVAILGLRRFQQAGHKPIVVIGGATALVGDPSGKTDMRQMLTPEQVEANGEKIKAQLSRFITFGDGPSDAVMVNNADWFKTIGYIDFLRDVGSHISVNKMLSQESVKLRLERQDRGLTFLEFNYMLLQAYDFAYLNKHYGCLFQFGGDDQWGNIVTGTELIHKMNRQQAFAMTFPLLTTAAGEKMGKTVAGAVWLDADRCSPYEFFQYWRNTDDRDVTRFLKIFTELSQDDITVAGQLDVNAQKEKLAFEATRLVHGIEAADAALASARAMFMGATKNDADVQAAQLMSLDQLDSLPTFEVAGDKLASTRVIDALVGLGFAASLSAARRAIAQGGIALNFEKITEAERRLSLTDFPNAGEFALLTFGKKQRGRIRYVT